MKPCRGLAVFDSAVPPVRAPGSLAASTFVTHPGTASGAADQHERRPPSRPARRAAPPGPPGPPRRGRGTGRRGPAVPASPAAPGRCRARRVWPFDSLMNGCVELVREPEPLRSAAAPRRRSRRCRSGGSRSSDSGSSRVGELEPLLVVVPGVGEQPRLFLERDVRGPPRDGVIDAPARGPEAVEQRPADVAGVRAWCRPRSASASVVLPDADRPDDGPRLALADRPGEVVRARPAAGRGRRSRGRVRDGSALSASARGGRWSLAAPLAAIRPPPPRGASRRVPARPRAGVSAGPVCVATTRRLPSGDSTAPRTVSTPSSTFDVVPIGTRHPPPSAYSIARSACTRANVSASRSAATASLRLGVVGAALQADRPLPHRRQHPRRVENLRDAVREAEPHQPGFREDDRVEVLLVELPQPRLDVAAQVDELQVGPAVEHLRPAAQAARADRRAFGQVVEPRGASRDTNASPVGPRGGTATSSSCGSGIVGQVFEAVNGDVRAAVEQRVLDGLREHAEPAHRGRAPSPGRGRRASR